MISFATRRKRVTFVGLGNMGYPMARRLMEAGIDLVVHDADPDRRRAFSDETGANWASTAAEAAADCDMAVLMLPNGKIVEQVVRGGQGTPLYAAMRRGGLIIDMSSVHPYTYHPLLEETAASGVTFVDAPVSGGVKGAREGTLTIMVGGSPADIERARPVFDAVGRTTFEMGPLGSGQAMKALNNLLSAGTLILTIETLLLGKHFGLDPLLMNRVLNMSTGKNNSTDRKVEQFILSGSYASGFAHSLMAKDVAIALSLDADGRITPLSHLAGQIVAAAAQHLEAAADHTEIARYIETIAKLPLSSQQGSGLDLPVPGDEDAQ